MKILIGNEIDVYLKSSNCNTVPDVGGILIEVTDGELFVQGAGTTMIWVIPRDNIKYCTILTMSTGDRIITKHEEQKKEISKQENNLQCEQFDTTHLKVHVNGELIADIPVPPTFNMSRWHEGIMRTYMGNPDVMQFLVNKIQKSINYYPGKVYIEAEEEIVEENKSKESCAQNTFAMGADITTTYLTPTEMILRLDSLKGKKNETKV